VRFALRTAFLSLLLLGSTAAFPQSEPSKLFETMQALDTQLFDAANHCDYEKLPERRFIGAFSDTELIGGFIATNLFIYPMTRR
jgi:hypothetical protein